jgi:serine/threonine protein phosphatase PrpC
MTPEAAPGADDGAGADPAVTGKNVVHNWGYASTAGYEPTGHKKTNQDAFCVLEVRCIALVDTRGTADENHIQHTYPACGFLPTLVGPLRPQDFAGVRNQYVFGVFDGHGRAGHKASNFIASEVGQCLSSSGADDLHLRANRMMATGCP